MKILAISHEYPPVGGGGANACMFLTKGFVENGHDVTLVTVQFPGLMKEEIIDGVKIIRVPSKRAHKEHCSFAEMLSYLKKAYPVACKLQKEEKFDVCLVFFGIPAGPIGYMLKKKYKLPYIIRFGGGDIPGFQDRFTKVYKILAPAIKTIWKNADRRIANSIGLKELAYDFCDKYEFDVVANGVDVNRYIPVETSDVEMTHDHSAKILKILFVSRLIERKGLQYVIPQLKDVDYDFKLTIVGGGPYRETLEQIVSDNNLSDKVVFVGQKEKDEIVSYYQNADVFILPSSKEGMPNVVLEAMSCGLPIIMTPCQGSDELVDETNGFVVDSDLFGEKLNVLAKENDLLTQMGKASRKKAIDQFSWDRTVRSYLEYLSIYEK